MNTRKQVGVCEWPGIDKSILYFHPPLSPPSATAYRIAKSFDQSKDCFLKACDCHKQNKAWFHAAKALEQVILVCKETNNLIEVHQFAERACQLYQQHGSPEAAASALDKAAKMMEANHPEKALQLYQHALDVVMVSECGGVILNIPLLTIAPLAD